MGIIGNDLTLALFLISVLGHRDHPSRDILEREMYTKQPPRTGRLVEDMRGSNLEKLKEPLEYLEPQ